MRKSSPTLRRPSFALLAVGALVVSCTSACAGTQFARSTNAERLPADGSAGGPQPAALPLQMMAPAEWAAAPKQRIAPVCDARNAAAPHVETAELDKAKKAIDLWTDVQKKKPQPKPAGKNDVNVGQVLGLSPEPTRRVQSLTLSCAAGSAVLDVNGVAHPFDLAWVVTKTPPGNGTTVVSIQALSLKEKKLVFARLSAFADPKAAGDDTIIVANLASFMPSGEVDEPIVRNSTSASAQPTFETLLVGKGTTEGYYVIVPQNADLSPARYLTVGRFKVGAP